jgi:hypothetical protein
VFKGTPGRRGRGLFERLARWRLEQDELRFPIDAKLFGVWNRIERKVLGRLEHKKDLVDQALG